jgi:hypothetical protein
MRLGACCPHLGTEHNKLVKLVEKSILPPAAFSVSLFHDQLWINLPGKQKDQSGSVMGLY